MIADSPECSYYTIPCGRYFSSAVLVDILVIYGSCIFWSESVLVIWFGLAFFSRG